MHGDLIAIFKPCDIDGNMALEESVFEVRFQVQAVGCRFYCLLKSGLHGQAVGIVEVYAAGFDYMDWLESLRIEKLVLSFFIDYV